MITFVNVLEGNLKLLSSVLSYIGIYHLYETFLERQVKKKVLPGNIGIILDNNGGDESNGSVSEQSSHAINVNYKTKSIIEWCQILGIKIVTLLALPPARKHSDYTNIEQELYNLLRDDGLFHRHKLRVKGLGDINRFPSSIRKTLSELEGATSKYNENFLNIAVENGGRLEIIEVVRALAEKVSRGELEPQNIDASLMEGHLFTAHLPQQNPDLIIRTSGEERLTDFFLWQSAYSELVFLDVYWPAFRKIDLMRAIRTYQNRVRRFGQ